MHGLHEREDDLPVRRPGARAVHARGLLERHGDVTQVTRVEHHVHGHVEDHVEHHDAHHVVEVHHGGLLDERHHEDRERHVHAGDDEVVGNLEDLLAIHVAPDGVCREAVHENRHDHGRNRDDERVHERPEEVGDPHGLDEVVEAPRARQRQDARDVVGHLGRVLERDDDRHVQREDDGDETHDEQDGHRPVDPLLDFCLCH